MWSVEKAIVKQIERWAENRFIMRYGLAILVCLIPVLFWTAGLTAIAIESSEKSIRYLTRECMAMEAALLSMTLCVYSAIWLLEWRDRRQQSKDDS
jgi:hypothetical protein